MVHYRRRSLRRSLLVPLLAVILAGCGIAGSIDGSPTGLPSAASLAPVAVPSNPNSIDLGPSWKLTWQDDFTGTDLSSDWSFRTGGNGFGDKALQWFSADNAAVTSQGLVITADKGGAGQTCWYGPCEYTSAYLATSFSQEYGLFEARIKIPAGTGLWPAFWMLPELSTKQPDVPGEIDVIEVNNTNPLEVSGYAHDGPIFTYKAETQLSAPPSSGFHVYAVEWTPTGITWTVDGKPYGHISAYKGWPFSQPFYMLLDLAVGGTWPGSPTAATVFPAKMEVSWIRVYKMLSSS